MSNSNAKSVLCSSSVDTSFEGGDQRGFSAGCISRLACFSDCQELMLLLNADGHANELDGLLEDIKLLKTKFTSISFHFVPRIENVEADSLAKSALLSCNVSSFTGV